MSAVFHQAVLEGDTTKVKFILKYGQGIRVNQPNKYGLTALQQACINGNLSLANFLLERGADLSLVDSNGRTALHLASEQGHLDIVSLLVNSACADVNARNGCGQKAVDVAKNDPVRALLSQAMLSESFKQKCSVAYGWEENASYGFKNVPGWRYSISSTSTDSGVSEDSTYSHDSVGYDSRYSPSRHYNPAASYTNYSCGDADPSDYYVTADSSPYYRDQRNDKEDLIYARRVVEPATPHGMLTKSHSFTGTRHEYTAKLENAAQEADGKQPRGGENAMDSPSRYRRQQKLRKDPTRRKTVTFGENASYTIFPREEQRYPKSYSLMRRPISSSNRQPLPENWRQSTTDEDIPNTSCFTQPREASGAKEKDRRSSTDTGSARKEGKSSGILRKIRTLANV
ncbi:hypothetical protein OS493_006339 [Desmophyllum pertusum]|uniref:Uncharacterized protein n=1 Tax=Desmophyllum pertusum TaxID=174260 RepID=A0A9X0A5C6_9CNID|nr:hypothetical protein OS493_006339 [Desmophyllum pertusum]